MLYIIHINFQENNQIRCTKNIASISLKVLVEIFRVNVNATHLKIL